MTEPHVRKMSREPRGIARLSRGSGYFYAFKSTEFVKKVCFYVK